MKIKPLSLTLAAATLVANINTVAKSFDYFKVMNPDPQVNQYIINNDDKKIKLTSGIPVFEEEDNELLKCSIFQAGYVHYNYMIITCFITALDVKHAGVIAKQFKKVLDQANEFKQKNDWTLHLSEDPKSPEHILATTDKAEIVYHLFAENLSV